VTATVSALNKLMARGWISPDLHAILDYPLAAVLIAGPWGLGYTSTAATAIGFALGAVAAVLAVATRDWRTSPYWIIPPVVHGYVELIVTAAMIVLPFAVGFADETAALVFYVVVGGGGLVATLATRFPSGDATRASAVAAGQTL
jgi:hypothetical protein